MEDEYLEEGVHKENTIRLYTACVQQDRLWWPIETVAVQNWLDHDEGLSEVFSHEHVSASKHTDGKYSHSTNKFSKQHNPHTATCFMKFTFTRCIYVIVSEPFPWLIYVQN